MTKSKMLQLYNNIFWTCDILERKKSCLVRQCGNLFIGTLYLITVAQLNVNLEYQMQM